MEAKGHFSFIDAYTDIEEFLSMEPPDSTGLYECNVLVYVNMCDVSGIPNEDAIGLL